MFRESTEKMGSPQTLEIIPDVPPTPWQRPDKFVCKRRGQKPTGVQFYLINILLMTAYILYLCYVVTFRLYHN